jgi:hypothetical protein
MQVNQVNCVDGSDEINELPKSTPFSFQPGQFNLLSNKRSKATARMITIFQALESIKSGGENLLFLSAMRACNKEDDLYKKIKSKLQAISWNAFVDVEDSRRFASMTGYMYFEKEDLSPEEITNYKCYFKSQPFIVAGWKTITGTGIGCLVKVANVDETNFKDVWNRINKRLGVWFDKTSRKLLIYREISNDPKIYINEIVRPFHYYSYRKTNNHTNEFSFSDIHLRESYKREINL